MKLNRQMNLKRASRDTCAQLQQAPDAIKCFANRTKFDERTGSVSGVPWSVPQNVQRSITKRADGAKLALDGIVTLQQGFTDAYHISYAWSL